MILLWLLFNLNCLIKRVSI